MWTIILSEREYLEYLLDAERAETYKITVYQWQGFYRASSVIKENIIDFLVNNLNNPSNIQIENIIYRIMRVKPAA